MSDVTEAGRRAIGEIAGLYGVSPAAVEEMARAVAAGGGTMAQFDIPELGGSGQWMAGGMTMVGDMFNSGLQARVGGLCADLSSAMANTAFFERPVLFGGGSAWWPEELGTPSVVAGQNQTRYAYFPSARRIALDPGDGSPVVVLDTLDHQIGGFSQQQAGMPSDPFDGLTFSSQMGQFAVGSLPRVGVAAKSPAAEASPPVEATPSAPAPAAPEPTAPEPAAQAPSEPSEPSPPAAVDPAPVPDAFAAPQADVRTSPMAEAEGAAGVVQNADDILSAIGRLAALKESGALTDEEFAAKKAELLARL